MTGSSPASRSIPRAGIARASPIRTPVTAISPNSAVQAAARIAGRRTAQAATTAARSSLVKMNGAGRLPCPGNTPFGGISVAGSTARSQVANPRTADSR